MASGAAQTPMSAVEFDGQEERAAEGKISDAYARELEQAVWDLFHAHEAQAARELRLQEMREQGHAPQQPHMSLTVLRGIPPVARSSSRPNTKFFAEGTQAKPLQPWGGKGGGKGYGKGSGKGAWGWTIGAGAGGVGAGAAPGSTMMWAVAAAAFAAACSGVAARRLGSARVGAC
mmetsp:Transcript_118021/g.338547  ORF Transcript_118021/g.338547 Transcript_118021/m.338547 type:complete len:175 (+) Transcript_118021:118-642(+)